MRSKELYIYTGTETFAKKNMNKQSFCGRKRNMLVDDN